MLKFFRRTAHVVSIVALFVLTFPRAALSAPQASPKEQNEPAEDRKQNEDIRVLSAELQSIRERQAENEANSAKRQTENGPNWSNWALVIVGAFTFAVVLYQSVQTRRAADATRDGIQQADRHFRLVNKQWLDIVGWRYERQNIDRGHVLLKTSCVITNKTRIPLFLVKAETWSDPAANTGGGWHENMLAPESSVTIRLANYIVSPTEAAASFRFTIIGRLHFVSLDQKETQMFGIAGCLDTDGCHFTPIGISLQAVLDTIQKKQQA